MQIISIYEPIQDELHEVEERLRGTGQVGFSSLAQVLDHVLGSPGKLVRPAVTLLAGKFHSNHPELLIPMGMAVEMLHLATLIHDDTVDNSTLRRGKPTVNSTWGRNIAVLLGDYVFANSAVLVCSTNNVRVIDLFSKTLMALSSGELRELFSNYDWRQTRQNYWDRIENKTASLFTTAAESGAILSGASEEVVAAMKAYGHNLGMAFQIVDDILDFEGDQKEVGKPVGNDLLQGVLTLPALLLLERYPDDNPILKVFQDPDNEKHLGAAIEMVRNSSVIEESHAIAEQFCGTAHDALQPLPDNPYRRALSDLLDYALSRNK